MDLWRQVGLVNTWSTIMYASTWENWTSVHFPNILYITHLCTMFFFLFRCASRQRSANKDHTAANNDQKHTTISTTQRNMPWQCWEPAITYNNCSEECSTSANINTTNNIAQRVNKSVQNQQWLSQRTDLTILLELPCAKGRSVKTLKNTQKKNTKWNGGTCQLQRSEEICAPVMAVHLEMPFA